MQANGVAIVGLGNALAHDDAAGLEAVRRLRAQAETAGIAVHEHEGSPLTLLDLWEGLDGVVLVDAVHGAGAPGSIHCFDASADAIPARLSRSASTHAVGAGEAIELGRTLGRLPRSILFIGVEGARFDAGAGLSTDVEDALDALAETALREALAVAPVVSTPPRRRAADGAPNRPADACSIVRTAAAPILAIEARAGSEKPEVVRLRDRSAVSIRSVRQQDEAPLRTFLAELCPEARRLRFFTGAADMRQAAHWAASDVADHYGLIAHDATGELVGHASYAQLDPGRAEVAVEVADHLNGRGLGTILIGRLARIAEQRGVNELIAEVLPENRAMLSVFRDGFDAKVVFHEGIETVVLPTSAWRLAQARFENGDAPDEPGSEAPAIARRRLRQTTDVCRERRV